MKWRASYLLVASVVLAVISLALYISPSVEERHPYPDAVVVLDHVIDGDTFWARSVYGFKEGQTFKVRLADIDAPERGEDGFEAATDELNKLLSSASCIVLDVDDPPYDRYGRVVAVVYVSLGDVFINVNTYLADSNFARYVDYPGSFHPEHFERSFSADIVGRYC